MAHEKVYEPRVKFTGVPGDVSAFNISRDISGGFATWAVGNAGAGGGSITLASDGSPWKSPLVATGAAVTIDVAADTDSAFYRVATMIVPDADGAARTFDKTFTISDDMRALQAPMVMPATLPASPVDASSGIIAICTKAGVPYDVEPSGLMVPALLFSAKTGWEAIQDIAQKTLGSAWLDEDGKVVYRKAASMRGVGTPVEAIKSLDTVEDVPYRISQDGVSDRCTVTYSPITVETVTDYSLTVWEATDPIELAPNETLTIEQDLDHNVAGLAPFKSIFDESSPAEQYSRWNAGTEKEGGEPAASTAVTITATLITAARVRFTIKNNINQSLWLSEDSSLVLRANKRASAGVAITLETGADEDTARNPLEIDLGMYAGSEANAKALLGWLAQQAAAPRAQIEGMKVVPDPARRLGNLVTFSDPITGASSRAIITSTNLAGRNGELTQEVTLTLVPGTNPGAPTTAAKVTEPLGTSAARALAERQYIRDVKTGQAHLTDLTPPPAPSAPVVSARLGVISVGFDGLTNTGAAMPLRVERIEIAVGSAPSPTTVVDNISPAGGTANVADQPYSQTRYVRMRAVNYSGIAGPWGAEQTVVVKPLVDTDLIGKVIAEANLQDNSVSARTIVAGSVTTAKVAALAIDAGKIAANAITADKIVAGAITGVKIAADAIDGKTITGAVIRTAASGQRVQIDSAGLRAFNSSGTAVTTISASTGELTATGSFTAKSTSLTTTLDSGSLTFDYAPSVGTAGTSSLSFNALGFNITGTKVGRFIFDAGVTIVSGSAASIDSDGNFDLRRSGSNVIQVRNDSTSTHIQFPLSYSRTYAMSAGTSGNRLAILTELGTLGTLTGAATVPGTFGTGGDITSGGRVIATTTLRTIGFETTSSSASCVMTTGGWLQRSTSVRASKLLIEDLELNGIEVTRALRPRTWHDKGSIDRLADGLARQADGETVDWDEINCDTGRIPGFIAEEVDELNLPAGFATRDANGDLTGIAYDRIPAILTLAIQEMADIIDSLSARIAQLEGAQQ